ncbi:MAG: helix-turn-helix transcriptional regulator [Flavobacteriales bacterium]|nr:helix-turn-helix transcriptional regulator [Flavobacteriales bacterium]
MKGARIRQYRKALKLTQAKLAALVGISQGKISKIERDQQPTSMTIALRLCWALRRKTWTISFRADREQAAAPRAVQCCQAQTYAAVDALCRPRMRRPTQTCGCERTIAG